MQSGWTKRLNISRQNEVFLFTSRLRIRKLPTGSPLCPIHQTHLSTHNIHISFASNCFIQEKAINWTMADSMPVSMDTPVAMDTSILLRCFKPWQGLALNTAAIQQYHFHFYFWYQRKRCLGRLISTFTAIQSGLFFYRPVTAGLWADWIVEFTGCDFSTVWCSV